MVAGVCVGIFVAVLFEASDGQRLRRLNSIVGVRPDMAYSLTLRKRLWVLLFILLAVYFLLLPAANVARE